MNARARTITYKAGAFCQLKLASGERVLISISRASIYLYRLSWLGIFPVGTIAKWSPEQLKVVARIFGDLDKPTQSLLDAMKAKIETVGSIAEITELCARSPSR